VSIEMATVIAGSIELAREMREAQQPREELGLSDDEIAFYDGLEVNDGAVKVLGDDSLRVIVRELVQTVRWSVTVDWAVRENASGGIRVIIKRILSKHGYPPDKPEKATRTVLRAGRGLLRAPGGVLPPQRVS
jgi:type I restriction enzyme R subunit